MRGIPSLAESGPSRSLNEGNAPQLALMKSKLEVGAPHLDRFHSITPIYSQHTTYNQHVRRADVSSIGSKRRTMLTTPSFIAIKPDGVQRGLVGEIIQRFEKRGYKLVALKLVTPSKEHLEKHYEDLSSKPFFAGLVTCA